MFSKKECSTVQLFPFKFHYCCVCSCTATQSDNWPSQIHSRNFVFDYLKLLPGFLRKAAFCQRLAATRQVSPSNPNPDWQRCYYLMLHSFPGHKLSLDPNYVIQHQVGKIRVYDYFILY